MKLKYIIIFVLFALTNMSTVFVIISKTVTSSFFAVETLWLALLIFAQLLFSKVFYSENTEFKLSLLGKLYDYTRGIVSCVLLVGVLVDVIIHTIKFDTCSYSDMDCTNNFVRVINYIGIVDIVLTIIIYLVILFLHGLNHYYEHKSNIIKKNVVVTKEDEEQDVVFL
jgi:hypothetical protein